MAVFLKMATMDKAEKLEVDFPTLPPTVSLEDLIAAAPELSPDVRAEYSRRLVAAGFGIETPAVFTTKTLALPDEVARHFQLGADAKIDRERVFQLLRVLALFVESFEDLSWGVWGLMARKSTIVREGWELPSFRKWASKYLTNDSEVNTVLLVQRLNKLRKIILGLLNAYAESGNIIRGIFLGRFSRDAIESKVKASRSRPSEKELWRSYIANFEVFPEASIEYEFREGISKKAEDLFRKDSLTFLPDR